MVLVIIVTYNGMKWVDRCLSSLKQSTVKVGVFVVDNGSSDGTSEWIKENYSDVIFYQSESNLGFGQANNLGITYALEHDYKYVYLLNQDAWVNDNTIESLVKVHERNPQYGIISPLQCNSSFTAFDSSFYTYCLTNESVFNNIIKSQTKTKKDNVFDTDFIMAAHWLISRECFSIVGGFSPSFPHYGEDNNYLDRCRFHGFNIGVCFDAYAIHDRENRVLSPNQEMYLQYIHTIDMLSNPNINGNENKRYCFEFIKAAVKFKNLMPIVYLFKILRNIKKLRRNKELSMRKTHAFV